MEQKILQKQKRYIIVILAEMEWHRLAIRVHTRERVPKKRYHYNRKVSNIFQCDLFASTI